MKFYFFHLMPYGAVDQEAAKEHGAVWIDFPNKHYDPKEGFKLYNRYLDEMELADQFKRLPQALFTLDALNATSDATALPGPALNG